MKPETEQDIIEELKKRAASIAEAMKKRWRERQVVSDHCFMWPGTVVKADDGQPLDCPIIAALPEDGREEFLRAMAKKTDAYAIVLIEKKAQALSIHFECHQGTRVWWTPLHWHGDVQRLGETEVEDDAKSLNLLWSPNRGSA